MKHLRSTVFLAAVTLSFIGSIVVAPLSMAADARNFNAGNIIDDSIFTNSDTMSVDQIQRFLNSKVSCDTWGTKTSELGGGTRAQWLNARGYSAPFRCVTDYMENPSTGENNYGKTSTPAGALSAAQLIYNYSKQFRINPQVLIVTLQKENGLITDEWPTLKQFREAMGFGCPDNVAPGAPACDPSYGSFSTQLYQAARHFRGYIDRPAGWFVTFSIGQNSILWNPNGACGSSVVNIENASTAALYTYTPYRPNQAALNAQYGTGDGCSAYGNRNFYLYFNDWFGSTHQNSNLLRTVENATVYLVGDGVKYPIADMNTFGALSAPLGGVGFVSQSYLDSIPTGQVANRLLRGPDGTIYFYDSAIKLPFTSCWLVGQYGYGCGSTMQLTQAQLDRFANGPLVTQGMKTTNGKTYIIRSGTKSEAFDDASLAQSGINVGFNVLSDDAFNYLGYGSPIIRNDVVVNNRNTNSKQLYAGNSLTSLEASAPINESVKSLPSASLDDQSLKKLTSTNTSISSLIHDDAGTKYLLTTDGKKQIPNYQADTSASVYVPSSVVARMSGSGVLTSPALVKGINNVNVYAIINNQKRQIVAMEDLESITGVKNPPIGWVSDNYVNTIPTGNIIVGAGRLVMTPSNATVYMTDSTDKLFPMSSFTPAIDLGVNLNIRVISDQILSKYTVSNQLLSQYVSCGGTSYLGLDGAAYKVTIPNATPLVLDQKTCNVIKKQDNFPRFLLRNDGTIFLVDNMKIRPIRSYPTYINLLKDGDVTARASTQALNLFEIGESL